MHCKTNTLAEVLSNDAEVHEEVEVPAGQSNHRTHTKEQGARSQGMRAPAGSAVHLTSAGGNIRAGGAPQLKKGSAQSPKVICNAVQHQT